jgi:S-formylglutathione hydrolase FrmB
MAFIQCDFHSSVLRMATSMNVIVPEPAAGLIGMDSAGAATADGRYPVLWLLHGLSDDHTIWMRRTAIERYVAGLGLAVVMPNTHRGFYRDMHEGPAYGTFFNEELPRVARSLFPLSEQRAHNYIAGLSMGGYGAFILALEQPARYAAAASLSGVLDMARRIIEPEMTTVLEGERQRIFGPDLHAVKDGPNDPLALAERHAQAGTDLPAFFACCGTEDFLIEHNRSLRERFAELGIPLTYEEAPGEHNWAFWDHWIQRVLAWLPLPAHER